MKKLPVLALLAAIATASLAVHAASDDQRAAAREKFKNMTPEEKAAARDKMKQRWESMTPEQQATARKRFAERHPEAARRLTDKKGDGTSTAP